MSPRASDPATRLPGSSESDEELADRAIAEKATGETEAFEELVRRLEGTLYGFLCARLGHPTEAEEVAQETFLRAWTKLELYDSRYRFSTWLFTLAKRIGVSRARIRRPVALPDEAFSGLGAEGDPAEHAADREERSNVWRVAAQVLGEEQRIALWLRYAEGLSNEEIARILGRRRVSVRVLLFRARAVLARALTLTEEEPKRELIPRATAGGTR